TAVWIRPFLVSQESHPLISNPYSVIVPNSLFFSMLFYENCEVRGKHFLQTIAYKKVYARTSQFRNLWKCGQACSLTHEFHSQQGRGFF
ncbi:MAG: hypothetical protein KBD83_05375, partial [Gammaproteobacteria bacterium]|nr:hypothetical protein [Gammaproteobacteria bacterium]